MKPYPRANVSEGDAVSLSPELYNRIIEDLERFDRLSVMPPLYLTGGASGTTIGFQSTPGELVLVALIGPETGGGRYQGSIVFGQSTGSTSNNFQLQPQTNQSATDGPAPLTTSAGAPVNNALVINLNEPYVNGTHLLFGSSAQIIYVIGRVMGYTAEANPRTIVYIQNWPLLPVIAKITGAYNSVLGGVYYGRIVQGQFVTGSNFGYNFQLSSLNAQYLPTVDNCWITNNWEQTYSASAGNALPVGTFVSGLMAGFPQYSAVTSGNTSAGNIWYQVYTWFPVQAATLTHPVMGITTAQTAGAAYGANEQTMLDNLKTDVSNLQAALSNLYANLKSAGYSL